MAKKNFTAKVAEFVNGSNGNGSTAELESQITFPASLYKVSIDRDGETRVQFDVPRSALGDVVQLSALTDCGLEITVRVTSKQGRLPMGDDAPDEDEE